MKRKIRDYDNESFLDCEKCGGKFHVINSRPQPNNTIYRRRECMACEHRISTCEMRVEDLEKLQAEIEQLKNDKHSLRESLRMLKEV